MVVKMDPFREMIKEVVKDKVIDRKIVAVESVPESHVILGVTLDSGVKITVQILDYQTIDEETFRKARRKLCIDCDLYFSGSNDCPSCRKKDCIEVEK